MVQEFQVLRCFSCHIFQVQQVKKSKGWKCKLCGEKQSLLKVYGQGCGADCRRHVQKLNLLQGEVEQTAGSSAGQSWEHERSESNDDDDTQQRLEVSQRSQGSASMSRWNKYLEEKSDSAYTEEESLIYPEDDHSSPQHHIPPNHRKRKKHISYDCDFNEQNIKGNSAKLPKTFEDCSVSVTGSIQPGCIEAEDTSSSICHRQPALPVVVDSCSVSKWDKFLPISNTHKDRSSSAADFHTCDPGLGTLHTMTPDMKDTCCMTSEHLTMVPNALPKHVISASVYETGLQTSDQTDFTPKAACTSALPKSFTLFHTEEDFDENY